MALLVAVIYAMVVDLLLTTGAYIVLGDIFPQFGFFDFLKIVVVLGSVVFWNSSRQRIKKV